MVRNRVEGDIVKKGPWTAEEDEILMNFVRENGPKDWSSIRSKGLLPRTGKSCRLRWVNKLQPNLKKGCKFSAEEERLVLELQATVGNKWAAIATYLPGRTDNDVKNFWNIRQKRLARILRSSSQPNRRKNLKKKGTAETVVDETCSSFQVVKSASLKCDICSCLCSENINGVNSLPSPYCFTPFVVEPPVVDIHTNPQPLGIQANNSRPPPLFPNDHHHHLLNATTLNDLPLLQENPDFGVPFGEQHFMEMEGFAYQEAFQLGNMSQKLNLGVLVEQLEATGQNYGDIADYGESVIPMPDNIFGDFSDDMLDNLQTAVPGSSSS